MAHDIQIEFQSASFREPWLDVDALRTVIERVLDQERPAGAALAVEFADDERLQELNAAHRGLDEPTDVLSFAIEEGEPFPQPEPEASAAVTYLGDIAVSLRRAAAQGEAAGIGAALEVQHVVLHGVLHLLGYDHQTDVEARALETEEERLLGASIHAGRAHEDH